MMPRSRSSTCRTTAWSTLSRIDVVDVVQDVTCLYVNTKLKGNNCLQEQLGGNGQLPQQQHKVRLTLTQLFHLKAVAASKTWDEVIAITGVHRYRFYFILYICFILFYFIILFMILYHCYFMAKASHIHCMSSLYRRGHICCLSALLQVCCSFLLLHTKLLITYQPLPCCLTVGSASLLKD